MLGAAVARLQQQGPRHAQSACCVWCAMHYMGLLCVSPRPWGALLWCVCLPCRYHARCLRFAEATQTRLIRLFGSLQCEQIHP